MSADPTINGMTSLSLPPLPHRPQDGHKGTFGRVLVVGGSVGMIGAPVLAGESALRAGSGLVQVAMPVELLTAGLTVVPELIGLGLNLGNLPELRQAGEKADAIVIGPGLGTDAQADERLSKLLQLDKPTVVDADALNLLARRRRWPTGIKARAVLTPHPGEMKRLAALFGRDEVPADEAGRIKIAQQAADAFGQVILLKGRRTVITDGRRVHINTTGDSSLAKAGAGDVLSGLIGSLLGQGMGLMEAAVLGAHVHGRAGEIAGQRLGQRSVLARDVIASIGQSLRECEP